ncbi:MAG: hypothetical protein IT373_18830 [Polyangiaceae bacterium]|nr:hypothetical protein [Polyangiaceae bacterium]
MRCPSCAAEIAPAATSCERCLVPVRREEDGSAEEIARVVDVEQLEALLGPASGLGIRARMAALIAARFDEAVDGAGDPAKVLDDVLRICGSTLIDGKKHTAIAIADAKRAGTSADAEQRWAVVDELRAMLRQLRDKIEDAKKRKHPLKAERARAEAMKLRDVFTDWSPVETVASRFEEMARKIEMMEAETDAQSGAQAGAGDRAPADPDET